MAARYGNPDVQTRDAYARSSAGDIDMMLTLVYALLALAVLIALLGIANTLTLAIHERTRELGLLRAVGQTRAQLRAMVRWESVLVAAFGTAGGLALGAFLGWVLVVEASDGASDSAFAFAIPPVRSARWRSRACRREPSRGCARPCGQHAWTCCAPSPPSDGTRRGSPPGGNGGPGGSVSGPAFVEGVERGDGVSARGLASLFVRPEHGLRHRGEVACRENHTTLPDSPSGRTPQLSLTAAIIARPRPQVAVGSTSCTSGRPGSWSCTETVSRSSSSSISTVHTLSGWACRCTLV